MLKLKDNISWEEIEKLGFSRAIFPSTQPDYGYYIRFDNIGMEIYGDKVIFESQFVFPRRLKVTSHNVETIDFLYKLIKFGFVERSDDE